MSRPSVTALALAALLAAVALSLAAAHRPPISDDIARATGNGSGGLFDFVGVLNATSFSGVSPHLAAAHKAPLSLLGAAVVAVQALALCLGVLAASYALLPPGPVRVAVLGPPLFVLSRLMLLAARGLCALWPKARATHPCEASRGKTVLVTTGRQAKTLHVVRALKEAGAKRVVVTDTQPVSMSRVSAACDAFHVLEDVDVTDLDSGLEALARVIEEEGVDLVVPMCSINSALFYAAARDKLSSRLPGVRWLCAGLADTNELDNKLQFAALCEQAGVPTPESGEVSSEGGIKGVPTDRFEVVLKRVASSMNREEEVLFLKRGQAPPEHVRPTADDPWQWQCRVVGEEFSAWYIAVDGEVTCAAQYASAPDLMHFEGMPVPSDVDTCLRRLIRERGLSGQLAFDYMRESKTGKFFVFECNPRGSSVLEVISGTPGWGQAFFGVDVQSKLTFHSLGFWLHGNCWPFGGKPCAHRSEAIFSAADPAPLLVGEGAFPLELICTKGLTAGFHHVDANIGKIITPGQSPGRDFALYDAAIRESAARREAQRARAAAPVLLHVFGSVASEFYEGVSKYYVKSAWENLVGNEASPVREEFRHVALHGHPDGTWSLPAGVDDASLEVAPRMSMGEAVDAVRALAPAAAVPHMYCMHGMTTLRGLLSLLDVPVLGNGPDAMALSTNKWHTRAIMAAAGVPVAEGQLLRKGELPTMEAPFILKPCREDNSLGISLFKGGSEEELKERVEHALTFDDQVIAEKFVPLGYEVRVAVVEDEDGEPTIMLPVCNYVLPQSSPIREAQDKLQTDDRGVPTVPTKVTRELPAELPAELVERLRVAACKAHKALGCHDYSIYDVRISPDGTPYFLEASLYCSFAITSIIVLMDQAQGSGTCDLFRTLVKRTIRTHEAAKAARGDGPKLMGM